MTAGSPRGRLSARLTRRRPLTGSASIEHDGAPPSVRGFRHPPTVLGLRYGVQERLNAILARFVPACPVGGSDGSRRPHRCSAPHPGRRIPRGPLLRPDGRHASLCVVQRHRGHARTDHDQVRLPLARRVCEPYHCRSEGHGGEGDVRLVGRDGRQDRLRSGHNRRGERNHQHRHGRPRGLRVCQRQRRDPGPRRRRFQPRRRDPLHPRGCRLAGFCRHVG